MDKPVACSSLTVQRWPADPIEPTAKFIDIVEGWNRAIFRIIDAAAPEDELPRRHEEFVRLGWDMRTRGARRVRIHSKKSSNSRRRVRR